MNIEERKRYNFVIFLIFTTFFFIYGALGLWMRIDSDSSFFGLPYTADIVLAVILYGSLGGWLIAGVVGGVWIGVRFVGRRGKVFIALACILAPITLISFFYIGMFGAIPFAVYNIVTIRRSRMAEQDKKTDGDSKVLKSILTFAHTLLSDTLQAGDIAVDCTMGNGHDTLFLANLVGKNGHVFSFDIQQAALENTQKLLTRHSIPNATHYEGTKQRVTIIKGSHASLQSYLPIESSRNIKAAIFNLGYLPGGDKNICTTPDSTIQALEILIRLMLPNGIIVIVVYPGHEEGQTEAEQVVEYCKNLPISTVNVVEYRNLNHLNKPPFVIAIEKL